MKTFKTRVVMLWSVAVIVFCAFPAMSFDMKNVIAEFRNDMGRIDPAEKIPSLSANVYEVTGMKVPDNIQLEYVGASEVSRGRMLERGGGILERWKDNETGYEYILRKTGIYKEKKSLAENREGTYYDSLGGLYNSSTKKIVILKTYYSSFNEDHLFHELVHAAQDNVANLNALEQKTKTYDSMVALSSLVEGQATLATTILKIKQDNIDKKITDILQDSLTRMKKNILKKDHDAYMYSLQVFPYSYGFIFAIENYVGPQISFTDMFKKIPVTTEQVIHYEKYKSGEPAKITPLEKKGSLTQNGYKKEFDDTMGEYFLLYVLNAVLADEGDRETNATAAEGWGGDRLQMYTGGDGKFFVWDTLWDTPKDAKEFYERYKMSAGRRSGGAGNWSQMTGFDTLASGAANSVQIKLAKNRVVIMEGALSPGVIKTIASELQAGR